VIVLREQNGVPETLLLQRNQNLSVQGGTWVFPGGQIDPIDGPQDGTLDPDRSRAVREAFKESGLELCVKDF